MNIIVLPFILTYDAYLFDETDERIVSIDRLLNRWRRKGIVL